MIILFRGVYFKLIIIVAFSLLFLPATITGQEGVELSDRDILHLTNDADGYFIYDENYPKAAKIYEQLLSIDPTNHNLSYKLGVCYLNMTGRRRESLRLLRYASEKYVDDMQYNTVGEPAHFDVLFYMAYACQVNMKFTDAIRYYREYQSMLRVKEAPEIAYIDLQIKGCREAMKIDTLKYTSVKNTITEWIDDYPDASHPVHAANDSLFLFTMKHEDGNRIFVSYKTGSEWDKPEDITGMLGNYPDMFTNSITGDGRYLIIARNDGFKGDIYFTERTNREWTRIKKLGKNINTKYWESHASISPSGDRLYFSSNRPGGLGSLDIYMSERQENGSFAPPENLGPSVNSILEENTPCWDESSGRLYFSSTGHQGIGGYDIYYSEYNNKWSRPAHLPYPINTPADDLNYVPFNETGEGLMSITRTDTSKSKNIFVFRIEESHFGPVLADGQVLLDDGVIPSGGDLAVTRYSLSTPDEMEVIKCDSTGKFTTSFDPGSYNIIIGYPGYVTDTLDVTVSPNSSGETLSLYTTLLPLEVERGRFLKIKTILFDFDSDELNRDGMIEIEKLLPVLFANSDLRVMVSGYTDAIGTDKYNQSLSERRARNVWQYMIDNGIDSSRIVYAGFGESSFVAENRNPDGTDNPEGRRYNRRCSMGIINDGYSIFVDEPGFVPSHLRNGKATSWFVVIHESAQPVSKDFFKVYDRSELALVKEYGEPGNLLYAMGRFGSRTDALDYLLTARDAGFDNARIISEYELPGGDKSSADRTAPLFTIQIHALTKPADKEFRGLEGVREIKGNDGFYRYVVGEYRGYSRAKAALSRIKEAGYPQAFIKEVSLLEKQTINYD